MPKRKKNVASAEKDNDKKAAQDEAQDLEKPTLSEEDDISKSTPTKSKREFDHRFHKVVDGKVVKSSKLLYKKSNESGDDAISRFRELGWIDDNTQHHWGPNSNAIHEGDSSKCPNCARALRSDKGKSATPAVEQQLLNSVQDVTDAWTTIPANTVPYFEFNYWDEKYKVALPLFSGPVDVNEAMVKFRKSQEFINEKPELKARVTGKTESHLCPNAYEVRVKLLKDTRSILSQQSMSGWAPVLMSANGELEEKRLVLKPRIQVIYTPQVVEPERIDLLSTSYGLKDSDFKPKEDLEGNDTTEKTDK
jgi:hypothetical protein